MSNKILMLISPENFRDEEYFEPKELFEENGYDVITASKPNTGFALGKLGGEADVDLNFYNSNPEEYDALVLVGGKGCSIFQKDNKAHSKIKEFYDKHKLIAAICLAPTILAFAGMLKDRKVTVSNKDGDNIRIIEESGAKYTSNGLVVDKNIVTASGPEYSRDFAEKIVDLLEN